MDALKKWMIIQFTPYQTITLTKWMFFQNFLFKSSLLLNGQCCIQVRHQKNSDDLCLLFCLYPSSMITVQYTEVAHYFKQDNTPSAAIELNDLVCHFQLVKIALKTCFSTSHGRKNAFFFLKRRFLCILASLNKS